MVVVAGFAGVGGGWSEDDDPPIPTERDRRLRKPSDEPVLARGPGAEDVVTATIGSLLLEVAAKAGVAGSGGSGSVAWDGTVPGAGP